MPASDTPADEGDIHLAISLDTNAMALEPNNTNLAGYSIRSPASNIIPDADGLATPFLFYFLNMPHEVTAETMGATTPMADRLTLDITFEGARAKKR